MTGSEAASLLSVAFPPINTPEYRAKLKTAWRAAAKEHHPDAHANADEEAKAETARKFAKVEEAHRTLLGILDGKLNEAGEAFKPDDEDDDEDDDIWDVLDQMKDILMRQGAALAAQASIIASLRAENVGLQGQMRALQRDVDDLMTFADRIGRIVEAQRSTTASVPNGIRPRRAPAPNTGDATNPFRTLDDLLAATSTLRGKLDEVRRRGKG